MYCQLENRNRRVAYISKSNKYWGNYQCQQFVSKMALSSDGENKQQTCAGDFHFLIEFEELN